MILVWSMLALSRFRWMARGLAGRVGFGKMMLLSFCWLCCNDHKLSEKISLILTTVNVLYASRHYQCSPLTLLARRVVRQRLSPSPNWRPS
jgi:hypothetical protein